MKNWIIAAIIVLVGALPYGISQAGTASQSAPAVGRINVPLTVPKVAKSSCKTIVAGAHVVTTFDVSNTTMVNWKAITSPTNSALVIVKRILNSNTAYYPASDEKNLPIDALVSTLGFSNFSAASPPATTYVCVELN